MVSSLFHSMWWGFWRKASDFTHSKLTKDQLSSWSTVMIISMCSNADWLLLLVVVYALSESASLATRILLQSDSCLDTSGMFFHKLDISPYLVHTEKYRTGTFLNFGFLNRFFCILVVTFSTCSGLKIQDCCTAFSINLQMSVHLTFRFSACVWGFCIPKNNFVTQYWHHARKKKINW